MVIKDLHPVDKERCASFHHLLVIFHEIRGLTLFAAEARFLSQRIQELAEHLFASKSLHAFHEEYGVLPELYALFSLTVP